MLLHKKKFIRDNYKPLDPSKLLNCKSIMAVPGQMNDLRVLFNPVGSNYQALLMEFSRIVQKKLHEELADRKSLKDVSYYWNEVQDKIPLFFDKLVELAQSEDLDAYWDNRYYSALDRKIILYCANEGDDLTSATVAKEMKRLFSYFFPVQCYVCHWRSLPLSHKKVSRSFLIYISMNVYK